jgi:protein-S-isoprenylcysteine O-methyltransferase Ste14
MFASDPVGLPGVAVIAAGFLLFLIALLAARFRANRVDQAPARQRSYRSLLGIMVQGVGIFSACWGTIRFALDPLSTKAIAEAVLIALLMLATIGLFHWSSRTMGRNWSIVARTREDHELIQTGPFAYVRHPIYVALFLFMLAMAIAYGHTRNLVIAVPLYALGTWMRIRHEERLLRTQFGGDYDAYAARVKRFVPGLF